MKVCEYGFGVIFLARNVQTIVLYDNMLVCGSLITDYCSVQHAYPR